MPAIPQFSATVFSPETAPVRDFYVSLFGLEVSTDVGWFVALRRPGEVWEVCVWDPGHEAVPAAARASAAAGAAPLLAFVVDDVTALAAAARAAEVPVLGPIVDEPWGQRHVFLQDPAGTVIDVVQFIAPDPAWLAAHGIDPSDAPVPA
ncbi:glyoxalase/bleomycin resistance/extradiol dioxygenase family protein [Iamia sp. SCSIO 61187]|uniref:VOC family protein n=1 Tax=Iamia sp. SCSIO 61187 TaxID=2722752 RepID=UPI001C636F85|nr:VOC family protein [Iamia sp. SCSIO 61187]QYG95067.1 glyoxalase/bleomycin resistance/extradiol dioxygenase family protein [Iamia sp. SCSIO 61187]